MPDLERQLESLAQALDWPSTPELASRVTARLAVVPAAARRPTWTSAVLRRRWVLAAAAVAVTVSLLAVDAPAREAIASWVNLHVLIQRTEHPPTPSPLPSGTVGERLGLGRRLTLEQARQAVAWHIAVPLTLGAPDEVYHQPPPDGPVLGEVTLVYLARPGITVSPTTGVAVLITEARGKVDAEFFGKMLGPNTTLDQLVVDGHPAFWIAGEPHVFFFLDADGNVRNETMRLAGNTLILDDGGTVVRIEGNLTRAQAIEIASSLA